MAQIPSNSLGNQSSYTKSFMFIIGTLFTYTAAFGIEYLPSPLNLIIGAAFIVAWLGYPIALHYDRKYVSRNSEWQPSKWYYLGFLPGYLGLGFVAFYAHKRRKHLGH